MPGEICVKEPTVKNKILFYAIIALCSLSAAPSSAVPVTWYLQDVVLNDGSTVTGSYIFDADMPSRQNFSNIQLTASFGDVYSLVNPGSAGGSDLLNFVGDPPGTLAPKFTAELTQAMTNAGGTIAIIPGSFSGGSGFSFVGRCGSSDCRTTQANQDIASGFVTTTLPTPVPLPPAAALMLGGIGALRAAGWFRRRVKTA